MRKRNDSPGALGMQERRSPDFDLGNWVPGLMSLRKGTELVGEIRSFIVFKVFVLLEFYFQFSEERGYKSLFKLKITIKRWHHCI